MGFWGFFLALVLSSRASAGLGADRLIEAIQTKSLTSVESTLQWISLNEPAYLENFTFMRNSRSLQEGSPLFPRAIVFGESAELVLTFNGSPTQKGFERIELIQFRRETPEKPAHFEMREIKFSSHSSAAVSEANPPRCFRCHHTQPHPVWDPYDVWDGAYGKRDDSLIDYANDRYARYTDDLTLAEGQRDFDEYTKFLGTVKEHPRYRFLKFPEGSPVTPYSTEVRAGNYLFRPNLRLTGFLALLQGRQLASRMASKNPCFSDLSPVVVAELLSCQKPIPFSKEVVADAQANRFPWRKGTEEPKAYYTDIVEGVNRLITVAGLDMDEWQMGRVQKDWNYFEGQIHLSDYFAQELYGQMGKLDETLPTFESERSNGQVLEFKGSETRSNQRKVCEILESRIEKRWKDRADAITCSVPKELEDGKVPRTVAMCLSCHGVAERDLDEADGKNIPVIDFADYKWTKKIQARTAYGATRGRMPPDRDLSDREREELLLYLESATNFR